MILTNLDVTLFQETLLWKNALEFLGLDGDMFKESKWWGMDTCVMYHMSVSSRQKKKKKKKKKKQQKKKTPQKQRNDIALSKM